MATLAVVSLTVETEEIEVVTVDSGQIAVAAGLRYVTDMRPGIRRIKAGTTFRYVGPDGRPIRDPKTLERIRSLAIPPAWTDVWICPHPEGHLQATGRDARGRKQYRYHPHWREVRDETKFDKMLAFAAALPVIRARVEQDLSHRGLPRERILATVVRLLETTLIRVGNDEYARTNQSYGLTTLHDKHVEVEGSTLRFRFRGKSGKEHDVDLRDRRLANIIRRSQALPGEDLFQYLDAEGHPHTITSSDVNDYLRTVSGSEFTAKDFRTWGGTLAAFRLLRDAEDCTSETQAKKTVASVIKEVAQQLRNTPAVCRKCYVHPAVLETYLNPETRPRLRREPPSDETTPHGLSPDEAALRQLLLEHAQHGGADLPSCANGTGSDERTAA